MSERLHLQSACLVELRTKLKTLASSGDLFLCGAVFHVKQSKLSFINSNLKLQVFFLLSKTNSFRHQQSNDPPQCNVCF